RLPLPSARLKLKDDDPHAALIDAVLAGEGFKLSEMKIRGLREPFFSKGERAGLCLPAGLTHAADNDELHAGRQKLMLSFDLPPGSYATLIVKRLQAAAALCAQRRDKARERFTRSKAATGLPLHRRIDLSCATH